MADESNDEYFVKWFVQEGTNLIRDPKDQPVWEKIHNNVDSINRQMMFDGGYQRLAECHEILGDAPRDDDGGLSVANRPTASSTAGPLVGSAVDAPKLPEALRKIYEDRFAQARRELDAGSMPKAEALFATIIAEIRAIGAPDLAPLLTRCLHNRAIALYNNNRKVEAIACFEEAIQSPHQTPRTQLGRFFIPHAKGDFPAALVTIRKLRMDYPTERDFAVNEAECLVRLNELDCALDVLQENPSENEAWFTLKSQLLAQREKYVESRESAEAGLRVHPKSAQLRAAAAFAEAKPLFDRLHGESAARRFPQQRLSRAQSPSRRVTGRPIPVG